MEQQPQWVGIDVSKANLDVHLRPSSQQFQVRNQTGGIADLSQAPSGFRDQASDPRSQRWA
jgi:transposase